MCANKGEQNGTCNITKCETEKPATWYNWGSRAWYCEDCARKLNFDVVNEAQAKRVFGHSLCTKGKFLYAGISLPIDKQWLDELIDSSNPPRLEEGAKVFETKHQLDIELKGKPYLSVYFVDCSLENTIYDAIADCYRLISSAPLVKLH